MLGMRLTGRLGGAHAENIEDEENVKVKMNKIEVKTNKCGSLCIFFKEQAFTDEPCKLLHVPVVGLMELKVADACVSVRFRGCIAFVLLIMAAAHNAQTPSFLFLDCQRNCVSY